MNERQHIIGAEVQVSTGASYPPSMLPGKVASAKTADSMLTFLAAMPVNLRREALKGCKLAILREAADLCGEDSTDMPKGLAISAILRNF